MDKINTLLEDYGLGNKEIIIYTLLVEKNKLLTGYEIAKLSKIHRSTTYEVLERLIQKGFVSKNDKDNKIFYQANNINQIISKLKDKEIILESLIPEIENLQVKPEFNLRELEGLEGRKHFNLNFLNLAKKGELNEVLVLGNTEAPTESIEILVEFLLKEGKKFKKKINYRAIWNEKYRNTHFSKRFDPFGIQKYLKGLPSKVGTFIYGEYVTFIYSVGKFPYTIEIKNKLLAEEMIFYFNELWKIAKR